MALKCIARSFIVKKLVRSEVLYTKSCNYKTKLACSLVTYQNSLTHQSQYSQVTHKSWQHSWTNKRRCQNRMDGKFSNWRTIATDLRQPDISKKKKYPLKLTNFRVDGFPHIFIMLKNNFNAFILKSYDKTFSMMGFSAGATKAVVRVSNSISEGRFDELQGIVDSEVIQEIKENYEKLDDEQRNIIAVKESDIFLRYIRKLEYATDPNSGEKIFKVTSVFFGYPGYNEIKHQRNELNELKKNCVYICNYRFRKRIGKETETDWEIERLNHFMNKENRN